MLLFRKYDGSAVEEVDDDRRKVIHQNSDVQRAKPPGRSPGSTRPRKTSVVQTSPVKTVAPVTPECGEIRPDENLQKEIQQEVQDVEQHVVQQEVQPEVIREVDLPSQELCLEQTVFFYRILQNSFVYSTV